MIYLDYSANTPADESVLEAFIKTEREFISNPNSNHEGGIKAREKMSCTVEKRQNYLMFYPPKSFLLPEQANQIIPQSMELQRRQGISGNIL